MLEYSTRLERLVQTTDMIFLLKVTVPFVPRAIWTTGDKTDHTKGSLNCFRVYITLFYCCRPRCGRLPDLRHLFQRAVSDARRASPNRTARVDSSRVAAQMSRAAKQHIKQHYVSGWTCAANFQWPVAALGSNQLATQQCLRTTPSRLRTRLCLHPGRSRGNKFKRMNSAEGPFPCNML